MFVLRARSRGGPHTLLKLYYDIMYGKNTCIETRHYDSIINERMDEIKSLKKPFMF